MENEEFRVRNMFILETDRLKKIKRSKEEEFVIKAPFPLDDRRISQILATEAYAGLPVSSFSADDRYIFLRDTTIDVLLKEHPEWWKGTQECPDEDLKDWLYKEIQEWSKEFQDRLKKNKYKKGGSEKPVST